MILNNLSHLQQRLILSLIGVPLIFIAIGLSFIPWLNLLFFGLLAGGVTAAVWEYYHLCEVKGYKPIKWLGMGTTIIYLGALYYSVYGRSAEMLPIWVLFVFLLALFFCYLVRGKTPLSNLSLTLFAIAYITLPLGCILNINYFFTSQDSQDGRWWLVYLLIITKITDTAAYFFGKTLGKHQLAPHISPKKTWEGAIGGLFAAITTSVVFVAIMKALWASPPVQMTLAQSIWLGAILSILAQFGDLAESLLKRDAGVKDSNQLPGLGGMLDIVDSLVFTAPLLYLFLKTMYSWSSI